MHKATTKCDDGTGHLETLETLGKTANDAIASMANLLHLRMFGSDVRHNVWSDYMDYSTEDEFLAECRRSSGDASDGITSELIWEALKNAVEGINCEPVRDVV
jgi:hypothetical protein